MNENDNGNFFPVWGTCGGHDRIHYILSGYNDTILMKVENEVNMTREVEVIEKSAYMYSALTAD